MPGNRLFVEAASLFGEKCEYRGYGGTARHDDRELDGGQRGQRDVQRQGQPLGRGNLRGSRMGRAGQRPAAGLLARGLDHRRPQDPRLPAPAWP